MIIYISREFAEELGYHLNRLFVNGQIYLWKYPYDIDPYDDKIRIENKKDTYNIKCNIRLV